MSHFQVAEEIRRSLDFSPDLQADQEVYEAIGESYFRVTGQDGLAYGVLVKRIDEYHPVEITGDILTVSDSTAELPQTLRYGDGSGCCECPLSGMRCCGCGEYECQTPSEEAERHWEEDQGR